MNKEELEKLGFVKSSTSLDLHVKHELLIEVWNQEDFITIRRNGEYLELPTVNTIEKVKQLIELLK